VFGQWVWNDDAGIVPDARREGASHAVRRFENLGQSVRAYVRNLNTHNAYRDFREQRALLMGKGKKANASGSRLAATLTRYSERREKYVAELLAVIRVNKFEAFPNTHLSDEITFHNSLAELPLT